MKPENVLLFELLTSEGNIDFKKKLNLNPEMSVEEIVNEYRQCYQKCLAEEKAASAESIVDGLFNIIVSVKPLIVKAMSAPGSAEIGTSVQRLFSTLSILRSFANPISLSDLFVPRPPPSGQASGVPPVPSCD